VAWSGAGDIFPQPGSVGPGGGLSVPGRIWQALCFTAGGLDHRRPGAGQARE